MASGRRDPAPAPQCTCFHVFPMCEHEQRVSLRAGWLGRSSTSKGSNPAGWLSSPGKGGNFGERGREDSGVAGSGSRYNTDTLDIEHVLRVRECVSEGRLQPSARGAVANRMGVCFIVPIWAAIWLVVTSSQRAVGVAHRGRFSTRGERSCHSGSLSLTSNGLSWSPASWTNRFANEHDPHPPCPAFSS